jgi:hypothetical protein
LLFSVAIFSHHMSNLNIRKDTFLNANFYFMFTSLNYPHLTEPFHLESCWRTNKSSNDNAHSFGYWHSKTLSKKSLSHILNEVQYQTENAVRDYSLSIKQPHIVALTVLFKSFKKLWSDKRLVLSSLLPLLHLFGFDNKCKRSIAAVCMKSDPRNLLSLSMSSYSSQCDRICSSKITVGAFNREMRYSVQWLDKFCAYLLWCIFVHHRLVEAKMLERKM